MRRIRRQRYISMIAAVILLLSSAFSLLCFQPDVTGPNSKPAGISSDNSITLQSIVYVPREDALTGTIRIASPNLNIKTGRTNVTATLFGLFALILLAGIFPLLFFTTIIQLHDEKYIRLWRIISYIHRRDGEKGAYIFQSKQLYCA